MPPQAPPRLQRKATSGAAIKPVVPVVPSASARSNAQPKEAHSEDPSVVPEPSSTAADVSEEEAKSKPASLQDPAPEKKIELKASPPAVASKKDAETISSTPTKVADKKQRPEKIDIIAAKEGSKIDEGHAKASSEAAKSTISGKTEVSNVNEPSQPPTPATAVSQMSATSAVRQNQPRTIRIPALPKAEESSPGKLPSSKQVSRRASLSSIHRPGTPGDERMSDNISFTSTSMSRANSPPPSKVGSAPVRQVTKSQQKKERQARAKQAEGSSQAEEPPAKVEEVQAPIIGRKKKTKKEKSRGTADSTPTVTRPTSPSFREDSMEGKAVANPATPIKENKKGQSRGMSDNKEAETPSSPATPATGEQQKNSLTAASILASLVKAGEITASATELFKIPAPGLNHRFENMDEDSPEVQSPSEDQFRRLEQGGAIHLAKGADQHVVVLPDRRQILGLNASQASRYVELRNQALPNGNLPSHRALDVLIPITHQNADAIVPISRRDSKTKKLTNKFDTPNAPSNAAGMHKYGMSTSSAVENMMNNPVISVNEAEQRLLAHKKEAEALEKKLSNLLKKNRRLLFGNAH